MKPPAEHDLVAGGKRQGRDPVTGIAWSFEPADVHWATHDAREVAYWLTRQPGDRLAQAANYRRRVHGGPSEPPSGWSWRFIDPFGDK